MTESLASELKNIGRISFLYIIVNFCLHAQCKALHQSVEQVYGAGGIGEVSFVQLLHTFWSTQEALGEDFKDTWVRVNLNSLMPFMSDITNEQNEEGNSDIGMFELQLCDVGTLQKPLLTIWYHLNTCVAQVIRCFNLWGKILGYCYTLTSSNQKQKLHKISRNGLQMRKSNKVYTNLDFFSASIEHIEPVTPSGCTTRTIGQEYFVTLHSTFPFEFLS